MRGRSSSLRIAWLSGEGDTPSRAAAFVKLRSSATIAKAARPGELGELDAASAAIPIRGERLLPPVLAATVEAPPKR